MALKENSRKVFDYVKSMEGHITAQDIADATGLTTKQVNGYFSIPKKRFNAKNTCKC